MFSSIRKRLTFTNVALTMALVFAMTGGAYAAKKYVITSTKQVSPTVLKSLQGKTGAIGPAGSAGAQGPQGPSGAKGETGSAGQGSPGKNGTNGVTGVTGPKGVTGVTGFTETLPSEKTETGTWGVSGKGGNIGFLGVGLYAPISFPIPLSEIVTATIVEQGQKGAGSGCPTTSETAKPEAEPGNLCIFVGSSANVKEVSGKKFIPVNPKSNSLGAGETGTVLDVVANETESSSAGGTWAVTAK